MNRSRSSCQGCQIWKSWKWIVASWSCLSNQSLRKQSGKVIHDYHQPRPNTINIMISKYLSSGKQTYKLWNSTSSGWSILLLFWVFAQWGRPRTSFTQISYAPKALDRSLAAYLRCDLKANVFVYSCNCRAYLWKQLRTYAVFFALIFMKRTFERLCEITCCRYSWQVAQKITPQK